MKEAIFHSIGSPLQLLISVSSSFSFLFLFFLSGYAAEIDRLASFPPDVIRCY